MLDRGGDQASGLRRMVPAPALNLMALAVSGGNSDLWIVRLAHMLRFQGLRPVVIDAGRGGVTRAFGLNPKHELLDLMQGTLDFDAVAQATPDGVYVLRAEHGVEAFVASGVPPHKLFSSFARLSHGFDAVLLAMPAGELACLASPAQAVPVIALEEGHGGLIRAYSTVKELAAGFGYSRFALVMQGPAGAVQARHTHARLAAAARTFLNAEVSFAGWLPQRSGQVQPELAELARTLMNTAATPLALH